MDSIVRIVLTTVYNRNVIVYLDGNEAVRIRVMNKTSEPSIGTVVLARVKKMLPSSGACFVDIGRGEDYFLQIPKDVRQVYFADGKDHDRIKPEDIILVQISSEAVKTKQPCVTSRISLHTRHLVIENGKGLSVSSKISPEDRNSMVLPKIIDTYSSKYHIIVRTESKDLNEFSILEEELNELVSKYERIRERITTSTIYSVLYDSDDPLKSVLDDWFKYGCDEVVTDIDEYNDEIESICKDREVSFKHYSDELPLCKLYKLETCVDECLSRKVYIKGGAFLVIEQGETLTSIDVNSGHNIKGEKEDASYNINLNAAEEIFRQLRLRNISGMILVDFINMKDPDHLKSLIDKTSGLLKTDDCKCRYVDMTGLGLMEITRKRVLKSFLEQWKASN